MCRVSIFSGSIDYGLADHVDSQFQGSMTDTVNFFCYVEHIIMCVFCIMIDHDLQVHLQ